MDVAVVYETHYGQTHDAVIHTAAGLEHRRAED